MFGTETPSFNHILPDRLCRVACRGFHKSWGTHPPQTHTTAQANAFVWGGIVEGRSIWSNDGRKLYMNFLVCDLKLYVYSMFGTETPSFTHILPDCLCRLACRGFHKSCGTHPPQTPTTAQANAFLWEDS